MTVTNNKDIQILIAADPDILLATSRVLQREGYSTITATDDKQALQQVAGLVISMSGLASL